MHTNQQLRPVPERLQRARVVAVEHPLLPRQPGQRAVLASLKVGGDVVLVEDGLEGLAGREGKGQQAIIAPTSVPHVGVDVGGDVGGRVHLRVGLGFGVGDGQGLGHAGLLGPLLGGGILLGRRGRGSDGSLGGGGGGTALGLLRSGSEEVRDGGRCRDSVSALLRLHRSLSGGGRSRGGVRKIVRYVGERGRGNLTAAPGGGRGARG
mmetsp:Transcript_12596/g.25770  ORF Transcript_12596/g.25770 Transcript_12596/m.25770 type:complete len:208 (-) Transcript_12596:186-809(-)